MIFLYVLSIVSLFSNIENTESPLEQKVMGELNILEDTVYFPISGAKYSLTHTLESTVSNVDVYHRELRDFIKASTKNLTESIDSILKGYAKGNLDVSQCETEDTSEIQKRKLQELKNFVVEIVEEVQAIVENGTEVLNQIDDKLRDIRLRVQGCLNLEEGKDECLMASLDEILLNKGILKTNVLPIREQHNTQIAFLAVRAKGGMELLVQDALSQYSQILNEFIACSLKLVPTFE